MKEKPTNSEDRNNMIQLWLIFSLLAIGLLCFVAVLYPYSLKFPGSISGCPETWGQFGDYVGGTLNPVLAFLGLCGVCITVHQQIKAMKEAREQFFREQFENRFFQLLGLLNEQRRGIRFSEIAHEIVTRLRNQDRQRLSFRQRFNNAYKEATAAHHISDYLQHIQNLLRFLQRGQNERSVRDDFFSTAMGSLLPTDEKVLLFYTAVEDEVFRDLLIEIPILAQLPEQKVKIDRIEFEDFDKLIRTPPTSRAQPAD